jgi:hypothetical protein
LADDDDGDGEGSKSLSLSLSLSLLESFAPPERRRRSRFREDLAFAAGSPSS